VQRIAVLGFAFKADTGDTRESAAITLIRDFQSERALVNVYDPQVVEEQIWLDLTEASPNVPLDSIKKQVKICGSALEACRDAEAVVIATEWKEFKEIDWSEVYKHMKKPAFVFDGRLLVDAAKLTEIGFKVCILSSFVVSVSLMRALARSTPSAAPEHR
jgi:UDPglucose 6-dehydrogenase